MTSLVYLEHSVIAHEPSWGAVQTLLQKSDSRIALSIWNLLEIAFHGDNEIQRSRLTFIDGLKPIWMYDHTYTRRNEVKRFVWQRTYGVDYSFSPTTPTVAGMNSVYMGRRSPLSLTTSELVAGLDTSTLSPSKLQSKMALTFLQTADKVDWKTKQEEIFRKVMPDLLPSVDPKGRPFRRNEIEELVDLCWLERRAFYAACPTIAVDDAMCEVRISNPDRRPTISDGVDLAHAVMALPYSDVFVVRDGYLRNCANSVCKKLSEFKLARVVERPIEANPPV